MSPLPSTDERAASALERIADALEKQRGSLAEFMDALPADFDPPRPMQADIVNGLGVDMPDGVSMITETFDLPFEGLSIYFETSAQAPEGFDLYLLGPGSMTRRLSWS